MSENESNQMHARSCTLDAGVHISGFDGARPSRVLFEEITKKVRPSGVARAKEENAPSDRRPKKTLPPSVPTALAALAPYRHSHHQNVCPSSTAFRSDGVVGDGMLPKPRHVDALLSP